MPIRYQTRKQSDTKDQRKQDAMQIKCMCNVNRLQIKCKKIANKICNANKISHKLLCDTDPYADARLYLSPIISYSFFLTKY